MFIHVAVPVPALDLLTYRVPDAMPAPAVGARVVVPLGSRTVTGIVVARDVTLAGVAESEIKSIRQVLDDDAFLPADVVALGTFAARALLRTLDPISRLRGRIYEYRGAKLIPTFHPAYLLRNPSSKREVWEDMKVVRKLLAEN